VISDLIFRPIVPDELPAFLRADEYGFSNRHGEEFDLHERWATADLDRSIAAFDGDEIVATGRNYSFELTLPGGTIVPAGAVSWISVRPTHRRRGILTAMMTALLDDSVERGESLSMLTASEGGIYGRFGYGVATRTLGIRLPRPHAVFPHPVTEGRVRMVEAEESTKIAPELFERVRAARPGAVSRPDYWWAGEWVPKELVKQRFDVIYERDGRVDGYAVYNVEGDWQAGFADKTVSVHDLVAATPEAEAALWQFLGGIDLVNTVTHWNVPVDTELPWRLADSRQVRTTSLRDWLWLRPLDVPAFLAARTYATEDALVLEVSDAMRPDGAAAGRFRLAGAADGASCTRTDAEPDLALDVGALGAISLGGLPASVLARAGGIAERTPGALLRADVMFSADRAPFAFTWF
jgi:predicted acetyltransferase